MFFNYDIEILEIENSTICNARCPQCTRQALGDDLSWFEHNYLKTEIFEKIPQSVYDKLTSIVFEGTMGDPCAAPNLIQIIELIKTKTKAEISIVTNGGLKNTQYWKRLARALGDQGFVIFSIDGLEDTNYIYRVGVDWNKLENNVKAFIDEGGRAHWQFIAFKHNEHQIDIAKNRAKELGFEKIYIRKTSRFIYDEMMNFPKTGADGVKLEPPSNKEFRHPSLDYKIENVNIKNLLADNSAKDITCDAKNKKGIYIDFKGRIVPCCFIAGIPYLYENVYVDDAFKELWDSYKNITLYNQSWENILENSFFEKVESTWTETIPTKSIFPCVTVCSNSCSRVNDPNQLGNTQIIIKSNT